LNIFIVYVFFYQAYYNCKIRIGLIAIIQKIKKQKEIILIFNCCWSAAGDIFKTAGVKWLFARRYFAREL